jgi:undecaprenyl phosphate-alpha-L-ara4FN deformylase
MMKKSEQRYAQVFGEAPHTHGAAGWQMNQHAFARHDAVGYATRPTAARNAARRRLAGRSAGGPVPLPGPAHIQMPTTLPTLDELLGREIDGTSRRKHRRPPAEADGESATRPRVYPARGT